MRESYRTLAGEQRHETEKVKGSRFIATAAPVKDAAEAEARIERVRREFRDASHHCYAWRTGAEGDRFRSSDAGEPGGSAGRPILQQLEAHDLTDVLVVVTRYFGGTKLGVGGLVRAYGRAASEVLSLSAQRTVEVCRRLLVEHPYDCSSDVRAVLAAFDLQPTDADYAESVRLTLDVPLARLANLRRQLGDRTSGRCRFTETGTAVADDS